MPSTSTVISASAANAGPAPPITAAVAAVALVFSPISIVSLVVKIVEPASFTSKVATDPVGAVVNPALMPVRVNAL